MAAAHPTYLAASFRVPAQVQVSALVQAQGHLHRSLAAKRCGAHCQHVSVRLALLATLGRPAS